MWDRNLENRTFRARRVSLVKEGLTHAQIDNLFEKEEFREIVQESFQTTKEELLAKIDLEIDEMHKQYRIIFEESQEVLAKYYRILEDAENKAKRDEERDKKRDARLNQIYEKIEENTEKYRVVLKENEEKTKAFSNLCEILNEEILETRKIRREYIKSTNQIEKERQFYVREVEKANSVIHRYNDELVKLQKLVTRYNNDLRRLRG